MPDTKLRTWFYLISSSQQLYEVSTIMFISPFYRKWDRIKKNILVKISQLVSSRAKISTQACFISKYKLSVFFFPCLIAVCG